MAECGNCRFWRKRSDRAGEMGGGYCVRYPPFAPSMYLLSVDKFSGDREITPASLHLNDAWPMVHQQSWCGEYVNENAKP